VLRLRSLTVHRAALAVSVVAVVVPILATRYLPFTDAPEHAARVIFTTGGAFTAAARAFVERTHRPCLDKPFDLPLLRRTVRETIQNLGD
jgi:hypothetical protein